MGAMRAVGAAAIVAAALMTAGPAAARPPAPLGLGDCEQVQDVYQCSGLVETWDGVPLDTTVTVPAARARHLPLVAELHGLHRQRVRLGASRLRRPHVHGTRAVGLVRNPGVAARQSRGLRPGLHSPRRRPVRGPRRAGVDRPPGRRGRRGPAADWGDRDSYGGGQSFELAALRDRMMLPSGRLVRWRSPDGTPLRIAAAAPVIPWTDLVYAAAPNGRTRAYGVTPRGAATAPVGVEKATFVNGIFAAAQSATGPGQPTGEPFVPGRPMGFLAPPGLDPEADVASWVARTDRGEPYEGADVDAIVHQLERYHSAYYVNADEPPAPLFVASGFTDDLFPVDEALRFTNRTRKRYPGTPVSQLFGDFGHQRAANKPRERARLLAAIHAWFDHYLRGSRPRPRLGVSAYAGTCPRDARSLGPFHVPSFAALAKRSVRFDTGESQSIRSSGGDPSIGAAIDPVAGAGDACAAVSARHEPGTALYGIRHRRPYTLLGAPTIHARLLVRGVSPENAQIAARLWDVAPDGRTQTLVARGTYRPDDGTSAWQLHPRRLGASPTATRRGSSCSALTLPTPAPPTASSRSTCSGCRYASRFTPPGERNHPRLPDDPPQGV